MKEKQSLEVTLENGDLKYKYSNLSKLEFTGLLCQVIDTELKEGLSLEERIQLTKEFFVKINSLDEKEETENDKEK